MRFALRNKTKLINAFGEAYYNELIASINSFQSNYTPDCHYWNEAIQKEMRICQVVPTRIRHFRLPL